MLFTKIAGDISVRFGQPAILGKLLVGVLLGPILGLVADSHTLKEINEIGVILLMFIAGLETDVEQFKKTAKSSIAVGMLGIIVPLAGGYAAGSMIGLPILQSVFLGLLLSATSVSISVQVLKETNTLKTKEGSTILGAAVIDDILVVILLAFVMSLAGGDTSLSTVIIKKIIFFVIAGVTAWYIVPFVMKRFVTLKVSETLIAASLIICFLFAAVADYFGIATIIGAYIAGIAISFTPYGHKTFEKVETIGYSIFIPVFFAYVGIGLNLDGLSDSLPLIAILTVIAILTKLVGCTIGAKLTGFSTKSSLGIGSAMVSRGEVALIIASIGLSNSLLSDSLYSVIVAVTLLTTVVTPPLMKKFLG